MEDVTNDALLGRDPATDQDDDGNQTGTDQGDGLIQGLENVFDPARGSGAPSNEGARDITDDTGSPGA